MEVKLHKGVFLLGLILFVLGLLPYLLPFPTYASGPLLLLIWQIWSLYQLLLIIGGSTMICSLFLGKKQITKFKGSKPFIAIVLIIVVLTVVLLSSPVQAYTLEILCGVSDNYELKLTPSFYIQQIPRSTLIQGASVSSPLHTYSLLGVVQVVIKVNATALNENGTVFFDGRFIFDSLAERKIELYRTYDAAYQTSKITLRVGAILFIDFENGTDINKEYHGSWNLTLP